LCKSDCVMATVRKAVTKIRCCGEFGAESNTTPHSDVCVKALLSDRRVGVLENLRFLVCNFEASVKNFCYRARKNKQTVITEPIQEKDLQFIRSLMATPLGYLLGRVH